MKIILLRDYPSLGKKNEIKEVKDGFAINFIIPQKIGVKATADLIASATVIKVKEKQSAQAIKVTKDKRLNTLKTATIVFRVVANEQGHLYSQISPAMIQEGLKSQFGITLPANSFKLVQPLKVVGEHVVQLKLDNNLVSLKVKITHEAK